MALSAEGLKTLIQQKEKKRGELYEILMTNTSSPEFSDLKRDVDLLGLDIEVLKEKRHKLVEPDLEERPYISNISTGSVNSRITISRDITP